MNAALLFYTELNLSDRHSIRLKDSIIHRTVVESERVIIVQPFAAVVGVAQVSRRLRFLAKISTVARVVPRYILTKIEKQNFPS